MTSGRSTQHLLYLLVHNHAEETELILHCSWYQPDGQLCCRRRLLTALGWEVVSVPYFDWNRLTLGKQKVGTSSQKLIWVLQIRVTPSGHELLLNCVKIWTRS